MKLNKHAQMGSTIQWMPATLIVILVIVVFLVVAGLLTGIKFLGGDMNILEKDFEDHSLEIYSEVENFLQQPTLANIIMKDRILFWVETIDNGGNIGVAAQGIINSNDFLDKTFIQGDWILKYNEQELVLGEKKKEGEEKVKVDNLILLPIVGKQIFLRFEEKLNVEDDGVMGV